MVTLDFHADGRCAGKRRSRAVVVQFEFNAEILAGIILNGAVFQA
jgi:hypothetical protein